LKLQVEKKIVKYFNKNKESAKIRLATFFYNHLINIMLCT